MSNVLIKRLQASDLPHVLALQELSFSADLLEPLSLFEEMLENSPKTHFIALKENDPLGYCFGHPTMKSCRDFEKGCGALTGAEDAYYLHDLCVSPKSRGLGVAKLLFDAQVGVAREMGFDVMHGVSVQNSAVFWEKLGFSMLEPYVYMGAEGKFMTKRLS